MSYVRIQRMDSFFLHATVSLSSRPVKSKEACHLTVEMFREESRSLMAGLRHGLHLFFPLSRYREYELPGCLPLTWLPHPLSLPEF
jgi:hypothetical protein